MVFTFLKARGLSVGSSLVEDDKLDLVHIRSRKKETRVYGAIVLSVLCVSPHYSSCSFLCTAISVL